MATKYECEMNQILAEFSRKTTWHGISDLFIAASCRARIFWLLMLSMCTAMLVYQVYNLLTHYLTGPPYQTIVLAVALGSEGVPFPNITICNYIRASDAKLKHWNISDAALSHMYGTLPQFYRNSSFLASDSIRKSQLQAIQELNLKYPNVSLLEWFDRISHDCRDSFLVCWWGGIEFDCCSNFIKVFNMYGQCSSIIPPPDTPWLANDPTTQYTPGENG